MEQSKEKSRWRDTNSLPISNVEWKKYIGFSRIIKEEECNISDDIGGEWYYLKGICNRQIDRVVKAKGQSDIVEKEVHIEGNSSEHKERVAELFAWNQEVSTENPVNIKEESAGIEVNLSRVAQGPEEEKQLDKEIRADHILQEQEVENLVEDQSTNQITDENCFEVGFHASDSSDRRMVSLDNLATNHIGDEGWDGNHVSAIVEPMEPAHPFLCNQYDHIGREIVGRDTGTPLEEKIAKDKFGVYGSEQETAGKDKRKTAPARGSFVDPKWCYHVAVIFEDDERRGAYLVTCWMGEFQNEHHLKARLQVSVATYDRK